uniref:Uncharacterized protein n=1 Tax=Lygus hesperus TaxID=30085 RepID=A0A146MBE7_LYGHE
MKLSHCLSLACCFLLVAAKKKGGARQDTTLKTQKGSHGVKTDTPGRPKNISRSEMSSVGVVYAEQDPSDPTYRQLLQLAIENVDETWTPPDFSYSPIDTIEAVESSVVRGEGAWYNMVYTTPNGWIYNGDQCAISFTVWPTPEVPTYKDVTVQSLQCSPIL